MNLHNLICDIFFACYSRNGLKESKTVECLNIFWFVTSRKTMFVLYIFILSVTLWALLNIYKSRLIFPENPPNSTEYVTSSWHPTTKSETTNSKSTKGVQGGRWPPRFDRSVIPCSNREADFVHPLLFTDTPKCFHH